MYEWVWGVGGMTYEWVWGVGCEGGRVLWVGGMMYEWVWGVERVCEVNLVEN